MNSENRDLLKRAAKSIRLNLEDLSSDFKDDWVNIWNPLDSMSTAMDLALSHDMVIDTNYNNGIGVGTADLEMRHFSLHDFGYPIDREAILRRAIVTLAAEISEIQREVI